VIADRFVLGLDAAGRRGWVGIALRDGRFESAHIFLTLSEAVRREEFACIGVDIPILRGDVFPRPADVAARKHVGPARMSSVFPAPPLAVFDEDGFAAAQEVALRVIGQGVSRQSFGLREKVLQAVEFVSDPRVYEVHPEVSFREMADGPLPHAKKSWAGQRHRRRLLARAGISLPDDLGIANVVPVDDVLDAAAAAWSADRIVRGCAVRLPADLMDSPDAIWA
jgi:predicted RNase H-like nuclease